MKKNNFTLMVIIAFTPIVAIAYFMSQGYAITDLGFDSQIAEDLMNVVPGLFFFIIGMAIISQGDLGHPVTVGAFAFMGVGMGFFLNELYTVGIVTDSMLNPATLIQVQELIILGCVMIGGVAWASSRR